VNWILDADIRSYFDKIDQTGWFDSWSIVSATSGSSACAQMAARGRAGRGTSERQRDRHARKGAVISPLLANVFLHYVVRPLGRAVAPAPGQGQMIVVRYADDIVVGFEREADARRFWGDARAVHVRAGTAPEKTRLLEFGRLRGAKAQAARARQAGDVHVPGVHLHLRTKSRHGASNSSERAGGPHAGDAQGDQVAAANGACTGPIPEQGRWLRSVVQGYFAYHAVPTNSRAMGAFRYHVARNSGGAR
jgi:RNA-directed DNA polymerase